MRKTAFIICILVTGILFSAFQQAKQRSNDVFELLGISRQDAQVLMKDNLLYASLQTPSVIKLRNASSAEKKAAIYELGNYMKQYFRTEEVAKAYEAYRQSLMPGKQEGTDVKTRIEEIRRDIKNTEEDRKAAAPDMKKMYDETIALLKKQLDILQNPDHPEYALYAGISEITPEQREETERQIKEFNKTYPETVQQYLKLKLSAFLELTADIDFDAKLIRQKGKWKFENPAYEAREYNWKKCFRAGKDVMDAARDFAAQWLLEIK